MHPSLLRNDEQRGMRMNGSKPGTSHLKSLTCLSAVSFQMSASPTRNLQCMSCGRSMLVGVCRPRTWLLSRSHCRSSEMLGALGRPRNRVPFFHLFYTRRLPRSFNRLVPLRVQPLLRCRLPFRPGSTLLSRSETVAPSQPPQPVRRSLISLDSPCSNACQARLESVKHALVIVT